MIIRWSTRSEFNFFSETIFIRTHANSKRKLSSIISQMNCTTNTQTVLGHGRADFQYPLQCWVNVRKSQCIPNSQVTDCQTQNSAHHRLIYVIWSNKDTCFYFKKANLRPVRCDLRLPFFIMSVVVKDAESVKVTPSNVNTFSFTQHTDEGMWLSLHNLYNKMSDSFVAF